MTPEELLIKRYKCIAPIPFQPFPDMYNVGDIFTDNGKTAVLNQKGDPVCVVEWDKYPNIFQPLPWWSDRDVSDMPPYVKLCGDKAYYRHEYKIENGNLFYNQYINDHLIGWLLVDDDFSNYEPATRSEYEAYQQSKNK